MDNHILSALKAIDVSTLSRADWIAVGMALTEEAPGVFSWREAEGDNAYQTWELDEGWYGYLMKF